MWTNKQKIVARALIIAGSLICLDLFAILLSGEWSLTGSVVGAPGLAVRLLLLAGLGVFLYRHRGWKDGYKLTLTLLLLLSLYPFHVTTKRMVGDGFFYYAYLQSFWKDFDVSFENEYRRYGILERASIETPTKTGYRRNIFSAGPAVLWSPFFGLGELYGRHAAWRGLDVNLRGNGPFHWNAVSLGTLLYGFAGVLLIQSLLRRYFTRPVAFVLSGQMAWAYFSSHAPGGFWPIMNRGESAALYSFLFLYLAARGGGAFSVDGLLGLRKRKKVGPGDDEPKLPKEDKKGKKEQPPEDDVPELTEEDLAEDPEIAELLGDNP